MFMEPSVVTCVSFPFLETNKLKLHTIQNIITTNKTLLELQELSGELVKEDNIRFNIPITYNKFLCLIGLNKFQKNG